MLTGSERSEVLEAVMSEDAFAGLFRRARDIKPVLGSCGWIWNLADGNDCPGMSVALCLMPGPATPHYHVGETEMYYVVRGRGRVTFGHETQLVVPGSCVVIPPQVVHFTVPHELLVMIVTNSPAFSAERMIELSRDHADYIVVMARFQTEMYEELVRRGMVDRGEHPLSLEDQAEDLAHMLTLAPSGPPSWPATDVLERWLPELA